MPQKHRISKLKKRQCKKVLCKVDAFSLPLTQPPSIHNKKGKTIHRQLFSPFGVALILTPFSFSCCSQQKRREKPRLFLVHHKEFVLAVCKAISIFKPMLCKRLRSSLKTCHRQLFSPFGVALILTPFHFLVVVKKKTRKTSSFSGAP